MNPRHTKPRPAPHRSSGGFTLIEMAVAVIVAGILVAMAVPAFTRFTMSSHLASQTNELVSAVQLARSEAIKRNTGLQLCRANSEAATSCAGSQGDWEHWIVRTVGGPGTIVRRGLINTHGGSLQVSSTFTNDTLTFGSDGLARSGGNLVNASDDDSQGFRICSTSQSDENIRSLVMGAGSRLTTVRESGSC